MVKEESAMRTRTRGFTLVELVIAICITAIAASLALPAFHQSLGRHRVAATVHALSTDLAIARSMAIARRHSVVVCASSTMDAEHAVCDPAGDWTDGWIVFFDRDNDRTPDALSDIVAVGRPASDAVRIGGSRPLTRFQRDGRSAHGNLSFEICSPRVASGRVVVSNLGRVRVEPALASTDCVTG